MFREKKLSKYILVSAVVHIIVALAMSRIYAESPQRGKLLDIVSAVRIEYKEPEPPPKPKVEQVQPKEKTEPKEAKPKVTPKPKEVVAPVEQPKQRTNAPAPGLALESAPLRSRSAPGIAGFKGASGPSGDAPGMRASGGINHPSLTTKTGGSGLAPGQLHGSMSMPAGTSDLPGGGGKGVAGFRLGSSLTGTGAGNVDIANTGRGSGGRATDGPGTGASTVGRTNVGTGQGSTGLSVGSTEGMGEIESEPGGSKPGGGGGGPGMGGQQLSESRGGPSLSDQTKSRADGSGELPEKKDLAEQKSAGATGKKDFKAELGTNMTAVTNKTLDEPAKTGFEDALQGEINKNLYSLRKVHEDWKNLKIPNIPKALQITIELNMEESKVKLMKIDFHNEALSKKIQDDLTKKIGEWKFESLYDGKDDPKKWPIKLTGKISWQ